MKLLEINHVEKSFDNLNVLKRYIIKCGRWRDRFHHRPFRFRKIYSAALHYHVGDYG